MRGVIIAFSPQPSAIARPGRYLNPAGWEALRRGCGGLPGPHWLTASRTLWWFRVFTDFFSFVSNRARAYLWTAARREPHRPPLHYPF